MYVGVVRVSLRAPNSHSLKDRRRVSRSLVQRIRARFNVSITQDIEADRDAWQSITLLASCVSSDPNHAEVALNDLIRFIEHSRPDVQLLHCDTEVISGI